MNHKMKKIPGTLYKVQISKGLESRYIIEIWYKEDKTYEKSGIVDQNELIDILLQFLEKNDLILPRNRLVWVVQDEIKNAQNEKDQSFVEKTVSTMIDKIDKNQLNIVKKVILMGLSNAGKTCIYERIFEGKKPWELMHSTSTKGISYKEYSVGSMAQPTIWDLGGQNQYLEAYHGGLKNKIFESASILLYVIDITDVTRFPEAKEEFNWATEQILQQNNEAKIYILLHKIDSIHDREAVIKYAKNYFTKDQSLKIKFFNTSILDESLFIAWSEVIREISPKSIYVNNILNQLKKLKYVSEVLLIDKETGLACGSTINNSHEDTVIGMISLLIVTIEKVSRELKMREIKELSIKSDDSAVLLINVNSNLLLAILLNQDESLIGNKDIKEIIKLGNDVSIQINQLWE